MNGESSTNDAPGSPSGPWEGDPVDALEGRLGVLFPDRGLALAALTHKSYVNEHRDDGLRDNERLEFLGDAVIDLAVSHRLMDRFPGAREGDLSKMRAAVVDEQGLADMARALGLGQLLRLGRGEELTGGRSKSSLLADAMEAVVAVVYLASGLEGVLAVVDRCLGEAFARAASGTLDRDYKTQLQELAQSRVRATPRYRVVAEHGPDHSKTFEVETDLRGEVVGHGTGKSKKDAEQAAAKLALEALTRKLGEEAAAASVAPPPPVAEASEAMGDRADAPAEDALREEAPPARPRRKATGKRAAAAARTKRTATRRPAKKARKGQRSRP